MQFMIGISNSSWKLDVSSVLSCCGSTYANLRYCYGFGGDLGLSSANCSGSMILKSPLWNRFSTLSDIAEG